MSTSHQPFAGGEVLAPFVFTTAALPAADQFAAWRSFSAAAIDLSLEADGPGFVAEQRVWDLGSLALTCAELPGARGRRRWRHLAREPLDHWCLVVPEPAGQPPPLREIGFRSLARPFDGAAADSRVISLFLPRDLFGPAAGLLDAVPARIADSGLGRLLADYLMLLENRLPGIAPADLPGLVEATRALVLACLLPSADRLAAASDPIAATLLGRARQVIQADLRARDLGPERLCRALGVSRSRLYRLFEPLGGVMRYIQRQRLLAAHAALSDAEDRQHIVQIADAFGFPDASGFSRAFRQEFGYTPREAREAAWAGAARQPPSARASRARIDQLGDVLRGLAA